MPKTPSPRDVVVVRVSSQGDRDGEHFHSPEVVALEFAGSERGARTLPRAWGRDGRRAASRLQWLDFAYLATHAPVLRLATLPPANSSPGAAARDWPGSLRRLPKPCSPPAR